MRVLTVANHLGARGGLERTQLTTCRELARRGHELDLFYVTAGDFEDEWRKFAHTMVAFSGSLPRRRAPLSSVAGVAKAIWSARRVEPDVLYVYRYWDLPFAEAVSRLSGAPVVFHLCLPVPDYLPRWLHPSLRYVSRTLAVSGDTARRWVGTGLRPERTTVVLTGVDTGSFEPAEHDERSETRRVLGIADDAILVLYAGRIGREKGVDVLVRAFRTAVADVPNIHLLVVGGASLGADPADSERYAEELRKLAADVPVTWLGARKDVLPLIQSADLAVVPSLWPEPLPRSILEPLACGVPVIASNVGGNPEILAGWLSEFLVKPGDDTELSESIVSHALWRETMPDLGVRCRLEAEQRLSLNDETEAVEAQMLSVVGSSAPGRARRRIS